MGPICLRLTLSLNPGDISVLYRRMQRISLRSSSINKQAATERLASRVVYYGGPLPRRPRCRCRHRIILLRFGSPGDLSAYTRGASEVIRKRLPVSSFPFYECNGTGRRRN